MANVNETSAASESLESRGAAFANDRVVNSFPRHDVVKLDEGSFLQWKQQVRFIVNGYELFGFLDGSVTAPPKFVTAPDGALVLNPASSAFQQQDNLLTSWLLSTISSSILSSFSEVQSASDVWTTALELFVADTDLKQSRLRHELHSLKKGNMSIREYVTKLKGICALLAAAGDPISMAERTAVLLAGLPSEFEGIVSSASLSPTPLPFQRLVAALVECENRQAQASQDVVYATNLVEESSPPVEDGALRGGRSGSRGRGRNFRPQLQC